MKQEGLNALIFGSTGAIGSQLVLSLLRSKQWGKVHCVVRKQLQEWEHAEGASKLVIEKHADLDDYFKQPNDNYQNIHTIFSCLGCEVKYGEDMFIKIDKTFPLLAADIAAKNNIPCYQLLSSGSTNPDSCFLYLRVKGEAERDVKLKNVKTISILKPGILRNRRNARCAQRLFGCCCCVPGIEASDCANSMRLIAQGHALKPKQGKTVEQFDNSEMCMIAQQGKR